MPYVIIKQVRWRPGGFPNGDDWPFGASDVSPLGRFVDIARDEFDMVSRDEWYLIVRYCTPVDLEPPKGEVKA